uniref:Uncharacterized protein n=1 Tax=Oryza rufipogon TaxID=4529 RepID=A0A0E0R4A7_ORYRU
MQRRLRIEAAARSRRRFAAATADAAPPLHPEKSRPLSPTNHHRHRSSAADAGRSRRIAKASRFGPPSLALGI